jgi:ParB-like nuclease domain
MEQPQSRGCCEGIRALARKSNRPGASSRKLRVDHCRPDELKPSPRNPNFHPDKQIQQIAASSREFGFNVPILIDSQNEVIAGHGRREAAKLLGLQSVPVIRIEHLTEAQKRAFMIADNKLALNSEWDQEISLFTCKSLLSSISRLMSR